MASLKTQINFLRKHATVIVLLLIVLLSLTCKFNLVSASSGGVMGGSFFDSDSSSSESLSSDSDSQHVREQHHMHDTPPHDDDEHASGRGPLLFFMVFVFGFFMIGFCNKDTNGNTITVLKLQVGMLCEMGNTIQRDLTRIAQAANTSSKEGVTHLLTETIQTLDQHHGYCFAAYSSVDLKRSKEDGEKWYHQVSNEERAKFDEETLVNLNSKDKTSIRSQSYDRFNNEHTMLDEETEEFENEKLLSGIDNKYTVIIILVAVKGAHKLPNINGAEDLKEALQKLKSLLSSKLLAGEVLWTPQKEDDTLSDRKILQDYPQLAKSMKIFLVKKRE